MDAKAVFFEFHCTHGLLDTKNVCWSKDNCISLVTDKGVYIFSCQGKPDGVSSFFSHKYFIENIDEALRLPIHELIRKKMPPLDSEEGRSLAYNEINLTNIFSNHLKYRLALWSPYTKQYGCLLSLVTFDHRVVIYRRLQNEWIQIIDVSKSLSDKFCECMNLSAPFDELVDIMHSITIDYVAWTNVENDEEIEKCYFFCASKNGHLLLFCLMIEAMVYQFDLVDRWNLGYGRVSSLFIFNNYLIINACNGKVIVVRIGSDLSLLKQNGFMMCPRAYPWNECDKIPVHQVLTKNIDHNTTTLIFVKNTFIIICDLLEATIAKKPLLFVKNLKIESSLYKMSCTGLCHVGPSRFLVSSSDGYLIQVNYNLSIVTEQKIFESDALDHNFTPMGLDSSPNHMLTCLAQSLTRLYDHLALKEPTKIIIFPSYSFDSLIETVKSLLINPPSSWFLREYTDLFQCLRGYYISGKYWIPDQLLKFSFDINFKVPTQYLFSVKALRYIGLIIITSATSKEFDTSKVLIQETVDRIEDIVTKMYISELCTTLNNDLTIKQKISLYNMKSWYQKNLFSNNNNKSDVQSDEQSHCYTTSVLDNEINISVGINEMEVEEIPELCPLCDEIVICIDRKQGKCSNNHVFSRCVNSLLLLNLALYKMKKCLQCEKYAYIHPFIWKNSWNCLFCS